MKIISACGSQSESLQGVATSCLFPIDDVKVAAQLGSFSLWVIPPDHLWEMERRPPKTCNINKTKVFAPVMWWVVVSCFLCFKLNLVWIPNSSSSILTATNNFWIALRLATYILTCLERFFGVALIAVGLNAPWTGRDDGLMCLAWTCGKDIWLQSLV